MDNIEHVFETNQVQTNKTYEGRSGSDSIAVLVFVLFYLSLTNQTNQKQEPKEL